MSDDLRKRLRDDCLSVGCDLTCRTCLQRDAADRITALEAEVARLRETLQGCTEDLERHARDQFEGVWFESDFESLLSPYRDALEQTGEHDK